MAYWLLKTEPNCYSFDDLLRDKQTAWDGVANPTALKNLRAMQAGDFAMIYHTGDERAIIGMATIVKAAYPDPKGGEKSVAVDLTPLGRLNQPVTLAQIKTDPAFAGWDLLRIGRLSVVATPAAMWKRLEQLGR